jgi:hypothetical protein
MKRHQDMCKVCVPTMIITWYIVLKINILSTQSYNRILYLRMIKLERLNGMCHSITGGQFVKYYLSMFNIWYVGK